MNILSNLFWKYIRNFGDLDELSVTTYGFNELQLRNDYFICIGIR